MILVYIVGSFSIIIHLHGINYVLLPLPGLMSSNHILVMKIENAGGVKAKDKSLFCVALCLSKQRQTACIIMTNKAYFFIFFFNLLNL